MGIPAYLAMGMNVVNVEYRLARTASAPAAVEDCRCALRWVIQHAKDTGSTSVASSSPADRRAAIWH